MAETGHNEGFGNGDSHFVTTHWSVVIRAGTLASPAADEALGELCRSYWYPLYCFIRRQGHSPHDAEDMTQAFFARLLEKNFVASAREDKGKFRTFLLTALKRFMANEWERQHCQKRGGFQTIVSIDQAIAEQRFEAEPAHGEQPDILFERQWAFTLLEQVMTRLQQEYASTGREALFGHLRHCLVGDEAALPYAQIGARLGLSESAVKVAVFRLRARYRELLREEIGKTVAAPEDIEEEINHLFATFSS